MFFFFKQKTAYDMRISDWSSDVCSSDLVWPAVGICEDRIGHPDLPRRAVHYVGEGGFGARHPFRQHDAGVIARKGDDAMKQVLHAHLLAWRQAHRRACRRAMPIPPCFRPDGDTPVQAQLTLPAI